MNSRKGSPISAPIAAGNLDCRGFPQDVRIEREVVRFRALSPADWMTFMKTYFGPAIRGVPGFVI
jgi:hypothetical protein